jgi:hypothetical protein
MIQLREISLETDYPMFCRWWDGHGWPHVSQWMLNTLGAVVQVDGKDVAVAWVYMSNAVGVCQLEWTTTDPKSNPVHAVRAISHLVTFLSDRAKELDYSVMLTCCRQPALIRLYERNGFEVTDKNVTNMVLVLRHQA